VKPQITELARRVALRFTAREPEKEAKLLNELQLSRPPLQGL
jgi:hypothetical protein